MVESAPFVTRNDQRRVRRRVMAASCAFLIGVPVSFAIGLRADSGPRAEGAVWIAVENDPAPSVEAFVALMRSDRVLGPVAADFDLEDGEVGSAADALRSGLTLRVDEAGPLILLSLDVGPAHRRVSILNRVIDDATVLAAELQRERVEETAAILTEQLDAVTVELFEAERALEEFRVGGSHGFEHERLDALVTEEERLRRRVTSSERLYVDLRERWEAAQLARHTVRPDVQVLDHARLIHAQRPVSLSLLVGLMFGALSLSLLAAFAIDAWVLPRPEA